MNEESSFPLPPSPTSPSPLSPPTPRIDSSPTEQLPLPFPHSIAPSIPSSSTLTHSPTATPPSTPTDAPISTSRASPGEMLELTRAKLERAAQGHISGRRGAGGLRELVLLSNVFGQDKTQWNQAQLDKERELREVEQRRKEDEERWLDGVLDEMLEEGDDEDEDFVAIYVADPHVNDSGFLEQQDPHVVVQGSSRNSLELGNGGDRLEGVREEPPLPPSIEEDQIDETEAIASDQVLFDDQAPTPPFLPPRSPPIDLPSPYRHQSLTLEDDYSCSPPSDPPPLTPDSTPPGPGAANDLLGTSIESVNVEIDSFQWISDRSTKRGLLALDLSPPARSSSSSAISARSSKPSTRLDLVSLTLRDDSDVSSIFSPSAQTALRLADEDSPWLSPSQRPPRSPSVPNLPIRSRSPPSPPFTSFTTAGIVKSFYDCVDFGRPPSPDLADDYPPTLPLSEGSSPTRGRPGESILADPLSLVLAQPRPQSAYSFGDAAGAEWRARSLSPEARRPAWARLSDVGEDDQNPP